LKVHKIVDQVSVYGHAVCSACWMLPWCLTVSAACSIAQSKITHGECAAEDTQLVR